MYIVMEIRHALWDMQGVVADEPVQLVLQFMFLLLGRSCERSSHMRYIDNISSCEHRQYLRSLKFHNSVILRSWFNEVQNELLGNINEKARSNGSEV